MTQVPAYLQKLPSRNLTQTAVANAGVSRPPHISISGGRFTLVDASGTSVPWPQLYIDVVIVDMNEHISQIYYNPDRPYDPTNPERPLCFSDNGIGPSVNADEPQSQVGCASCVKQAWGKINQLGNKIPWCTKYQKLAVMLPSHPKYVFQLQLPPATLFDTWRAYTQHMASVGIDLEHVVTRVQFDSTPGVTGVLTFQNFEYIPETLVPAILDFREKKATDPLVGRLDQPRQFALPAPQHHQGQMQETPLPPVQPTVPANPIPFTSGPVSAAPQAPFVQHAATPATAQASATASPSNPPQRRRRRTQAEMQAAQQAPAPQPPVQAPFRPEPPPAQAQPEANFGIVNNPPPPPAGLDLDAIFK